MMTWRIGHSAVLCVALFWILSAVVPQRIMMQVLNICVMSVSVAVLVTYMPIWIRTLCKPRMDGPEALSLGIGCTWVAEIGQRIWSILWRGLDQPFWMTQSMILPFLLFLTVIGGVQHITAPGVINGELPARNWIALGASAGIATLLTLLLVWRSYGAVPH